MITTITIILFILLAASSIFGIWQTSKGNYPLSLNDTDGSPFQSQKSKKVIVTMMLSFILFISLISLLVVIKDPNSFLPQEVNVDFQKKSNWKNLDIFQFKGEGKKENFGKFTFFSTDTMLIGEQYSVKAAMQKNVSADLIRKALIQEITRTNIDTLIKIKKIDEIKNLKIDKIKIGPHMKLTLIDPCPQEDKCFDIKAISQQEQIIESTEATLWTWYVTPLKKGKNILVFQIELPKQEFSKSIHVNENEVQVIEIFETKVDNIWSKNWQWILTSFGAVIAFVITTFLVNKKSA